MHFFPLALIAIHVVKIISFRLAFELIMLHGTINYSMANHCFETFYNTHWINVLETLFAWCLFSLCISSKALKIVAGKHKWRIDLAEVAQRVFDEEIKQCSTVLCWMLTIEIALVASAFPSSLCLFVMSFSKTQTYLLLIVWRLQEKHCLWNASHICLVQDSNISYVMICRLLVNLCFKLCPNMW